MYTPTVGKRGHRIGEVASCAGVSVDAVRYYEKRGLLAQAPRSEGGYRLFAEDTVERVRFIKQAQETGFSLSEIRILLSGGGAAECRRTPDLLRSRLAETEERMKALGAFQKRLRHHLKSCEDELARRGESSRCPLVVEIGHAAKRENRK